MIWKKKYEELRKGSHSDLIARINGHYLVFGESQFLPGYMILIHKNPGFKRLSDLAIEDQIEFMLLITCIQATLTQHLEGENIDFKRCNIEVLGNKDHYVHAHIWPRFGWESNHLAQESVRSYTLGDIRETMSKINEKKYQVNREQFSIEFLSKFEVILHEFAQVRDIGKRIFSLDPHVERIIL